MVSHFYAIKDARGFTIDKRKVLLEESIEEFHTFMVDVEVADGFVASDRNTACHPPRGLAKSWSAKTTPTSLTSSPSLCPSTLWITRGKPGEVVTMTAERHV